MLKKNIFLSLSLCFLLLLLFSGVVLSADNPKFGGTFRYAMIDTPPSLDVQIITSDLSSTIAHHFFEGLYTFNANYEPVPHLVNYADVSEDGKLITLHLREGVLFHNGKELTSEDVVASLNRWGEFGARGPLIYAYIEKVEAVDKYTINMYFEAPYAPWQNLLAWHMNGGPAILPKEIIEKAGAEPIGPEGYIGTGPYEFVEWQDGRQIVLKRFEDYVGRTEPADGYAGERVAYFDELQFFPVTDVATRTNGVKAGDYDYAEQMLGDFYEELVRDPNITVIVRTGATSGMMFLNSKDGIMKDNFKLRQALQASLDMEPALQSAYGAKDLWENNGSLMATGTPFYSEVGIENHSQGDAEKAKKLAEEAGYNGEPIRLMITTSYQFHYDACVVLAQQLEAAGFNIDLQIYDWATLVSRRSDPQLWDIFYTTHGFAPDPILYTYMSESYPGWWTTEKRLELTDKFVKTLDFEERYKVWEQIQALAFEEVPIIKSGDSLSFDITSTKVKGVAEATTLLFPHFWNAWVE
jgi:peptide/nickel transport system substrate-binding protein